MKEFISLTDAVTEYEIVVNTRYIVSINKYRDLDKTEVHVYTDTNKNIKTYLVSESIKTIKARIGII